MYSYTKYFNYGTNRGRETQWRKSGLNKNVLSGQIGSWLEASLPFSALLQCWRALTVEYRLIWRWEKCIHLQSHLGLLASQTRHSLSSSNHPRTNILQLVQFSFHTVPSGPASAWEMGSSPFLSLGFGAIEHVTRSQRSLLSMMWLLSYVCMGTTCRQRFTYIGMLLSTWVWVAVPS